ncbi:recombinase family protein [Microbacteriaceae bacterium VKM Ac-2854]|nr:recombinase family protein [Microbacteriaceae bacterium VKM Ac-2854]
MTPHLFQNDDGDVANSATIANRGSGDAAAPDRAPSARKGLDSGDVQSVNQSTMTPSPSLTAPTLTAATPVADPFSALSEMLTPKVAVIYLRVSTARQAQRGDEKEGFSIPAQRDANRKKAQSLGAIVAKEFVDRGESAKTANRPALQTMLEYVREHQVDYVVVHKVDRLARNREDDVDIMRQLTAAGVALVSATESIDQSPSGALLHGIMSSIAEFYSRNLAHEVVKGMTQKVQKGGTPGRAPLGYLNVRELDAEGRESRTVRTDPERSAHITWAFHRYAEPDVSLSQLALELA